MTGCTSSNGNEVYNDFISGLSEDQYYAFAELEGLTYPVLLVADGVYEFDSETLATFFCDVYYVKDGEVIFLGTIRSDGTAYPIAYSKDGIYTAGHHYTGRYIVDEQTCELVLTEYAKEEFAEGTGDETYFYTSNDVTEQVSDRTELEALFEKYNNAEVVNFIKKNDR